jgi:hypothetical protein
MLVRFVAILIVLQAAPAISAEDAPSASQSDFERQVSRLVGQLNDDRGVRRDAAEKELIELAGTTAAETDRVLKLLPEPNDDMPLAVRERLARIRQKVEDRVAKGAVAGTLITLAADKMPLAEVLVEIEKQTSNKLKDNRAEEGEGGPAAATTVTIDLKNEPFWPAVDQILDQAALAVYNYGGDDALAIVPRGENVAHRYGAAAYSGPFRLEILEVQAQRNLRQPNQESLKLQLEISWEPRLRPIALSQPAADIEATDDAGNVLAVSQPEAVLDVEVTTGTQAAEIVLPLTLPPRSVTKIAKLRGTLTALVPGRQVKFRFDNLAAAPGQTQRQGGIAVTVDDVRKNNAIWEIHMRARLDEDNRALESHRGWIFQNLSYLEDKDGHPIDNAGFETTRQSSNEVGIAYLFDLSDGIEGLTWVYETPAAIVELPVEYELKDIELP